MSGGRDQRTAQIAAVQRGRVSRVQLLSAGLSSDAINRGLHRQLFCLHAGVYAVGHPGPVALGEETAALLASPAGALLSHFSAAVLWALIGPLNHPHAVDVLIADRDRRCRAGIRFHRTRRVAPGDRRIHHGLPVVSAARAIVEVAASISPRMLERAVDQAEVNRLITPAELGATLERFPGHSGPPLVRAVLDRRTGSTITRSEAEELGLALFRKAELPHPETNARLHSYEVDFLWRRQRLVVEIDGFQFHGSRQAFERDRQKDARLAAAGYTVVRVTWRELVEHPYAVVARIAQILTQTAARAI